MLVSVRQTLSLGSVDGENLKVLWSELQVSPWLFGSEGLGSYLKVLGLTQSSDASCRGKMEVPKGDHPRTSKVGDSSTYPDRATRVRVGPEGR